MDKVSVLPGTQERLRELGESTFHFGLMEGRRRERQERDDMHRHISRKRRRIHLLWLLPASLVAIASVLAVTFGVARHYDPLFFILAATSVLLFFYHLKRADCHHEQLKKLSHPLRR